MLILIINILGLLHILAFGKNSDNILDFGKNRSNNIIVGFDDEKLAKRSKRLKKLS